MHPQEATLHKGSKKASVDLHAILCGLTDAQATIEVFLQICMPQSRHSTDLHATVEVDLQLHAIHMMHLA